MIAFRFARRFIYLFLFVAIAIFAYAQPHDAARGIPVTFKIEQPGYVTLVIENAEGKRIRNLIQDTWFEAGTHTIYWDGYDQGEHWVHPPKEPGSNKKAQLYNIHRERVESGTYYLRGLIHADIELQYNMAVQSPGSPPWHTPDHSGAWLADHTPPLDALFLPQGSPYASVPQILFCASTGECGHSLMWLNEKGEKIYGKKMGWDGGYALAQDKGKQGDETVHAYSLALRKGTLRLFALNMDGTHAMAYSQKLEGAYDRRSGLSLAVLNQIAVISLPLDDRLLFVDLRQQKKIGTAVIDAPRGLLYHEKNNKLFIVSKSRVYRCDVDWDRARLGDRQVFIKHHLVEPNQLEMDQEGNWYVSDWGEHHQVKVFDSEGRFLRAIGQPGGKQFGYYDERRMHYPNGMAVDKQGRLWVAECDYAPKRISVWDTENGQLAKAYYGPPRYGGGGHIDPKDRTRFYYPSGLQGMEFTLDWATGTSKPKAIYALEGESITRVPSTPVYVDGRQYLINTYNGPHRFKTTDGGVFLYENGIAHCVARVGGIGRKALGPMLDTFRQTDPALAQKMDAIFQGNEKGQFCIWSDVNRDKIPQANEIQGMFLGEKPVKRFHGNVGLGTDLSIFTTAGAYIPPPTFTEDGVPVWDLTRLEFFCDTTDNLSDIIHTSDGYFIYMSGHYGGPLQAFKNGKRMWLYHAQKGRHAPAPRFPGNLTNITRVMGPSFRPPGEAGVTWAVATNEGSIHLLTSDGLFITDVGGDIRTHPLLRLREARQGMIIDDYSFNDEHFWPSVRQTEDGTIYVVAGKEFSGIFEILHLNSVRRLPRKQFTVNQAMLAGIAETRVEKPYEKEIKSMAVRELAKNPVVDGHVDDWPREAWVTIDGRRSIQGALAWRDNNLYAAWRTGRPELLNNNASDGWAYAFATGGGLDIMLRTDPEAKTPPKRGHKERFAPTAMGDLRLFITRLGDPNTGDVLAVRYVQNGKDWEGEPILFDSPVGETQFDAVKNVSGQVKLAQQGGVFEAAIPLSLLGWDELKSIRTRGDIGILLGDPSGTRLRLYWNNKTTGIVSDIPSEAVLQPNEWGILAFE
ncbi:hypothetical protein GF373_04825 [bacterium]|nr:hypothetical protein [bacterium]